MTWILYDVCTVQPTTVVSTDSHSGDQSFLLIISLTCFICT